MAEIIQYTNPRRIPSRGGSIWQCCVCDRKHGGNKEAAIACAEADHAAKLLNGGPQNKRDKARLGNLTWAQRQWADNRARVLNAKGRSPARAWTQALREVG